MNGAHLNETDRRLTDLEVKASYAEDLLDHLNAVILEQQRRIDLLVREVGKLKDGAPAPAPAPAPDGPGYSRHELPPHY